jgi:hypothetical protein
MRSLLAVAILAIAVPAHADNFFDIAGGLSAPVADDNWTKGIDTSPDLQLRGGALNGDVGALVGVDWTPESLKNNGFAVPGASGSGTFHRFRILIQAIAQHHITPKVSLVGRAGGGIDIAYEGYSFNVLGSTGSHSDTNVGIAFEVGGGVWADVSETMQLGAELALPIGYHNHKSSGGTDIAFDYTSFDLDVLVGLRIWSR